MSIRVIKPGLLSTIQAAPRRGFRHLGIPSSGAADPLSLALANRLVGNELLAPALEVSLTGPELEFAHALQFAMTGAVADAFLNDKPVPFHETITAKAGDVLRIATVTSGSRIYIGFAGGLAGNAVFGSVSTYIPARLGGHQGRALQADDALQLAGSNGTRPELETPQQFRPLVSNRWALRACHWGTAADESAQYAAILFDTHWHIGRRADRMGLELDGAAIDTESTGRMPSSPVFPGTIQCPENGVPFLLSVDAQTTGGYQRVAQIARADRHQLGQLRPGDRLDFLPRRPDEASAELRAKHAAWREWLPGIEAVI